MAFKGLWKRLYIPWKQQSCSFLDFLQCFKVPNLLFSPLPRQNNFTFVVSCSLTWLQAATSIYQIWQPEVGTNFFFSNLGKVGLHHDQQVLLKTKAWIYTVDFAQIQPLAQPPPHEQHSALCQTTHEVVAGSASWCEVRLPLTIISSLAP